MKIIETDQAPKAIGPYSQAIQVDSLLFLSGQIPLQANGELIDGNIEAQTHQVLKNIGAVLKEADLGLDQVIKTTIFLADMAHFPLVNQVYEQYFDSHRPARSCVEVSRLPKDVLIEIEIIAKIEN